MVRFLPPGNARFTDAEIAGILSAIPPGDENQRFFEDRRFVPGLISHPDGRPADPHESLEEYERILDQLRRVDAPRFAQMHKGTAYYVMGWLAYYLSDFERMNFYMDAALSEDIANNRKWRTTPAFAFLMLNDTHPDAAARKTVGEVRAEVEAQVDRRAARAGSAYAIDDLVDRFIRPRATDHAHRSIVTALLTFMLEGKERLKQVGLRSAHGGTLEPFLVHLFKGGLIFESVLKAHYGGSGNVTMGAYLATPAARTDLGLTAHPLYTQLPKPSFTFMDVLAALPGWRGHHSAERAVAIAYGVRNTSGHDLAWPATLNQAIYQELYEGVLDAIFLLIERKY